MAVCVDKLRECRGNENWPWKESCHLFSNNGDLEELHEFAQRLGLKRKWFQDKRIPHYDLTRTMRSRAVLLGAKTCVIHL